MKACTRKGRARGARRSLALESLETRQMMAADLSGPLGAPGTLIIPTPSAEPQMYDGTGNNLANPQWGSTDEQLLRFVAAAYADGIDAPAGTDRPSAREISNALVAQDPETAPSSRNLSAYLYFWGQFIDHDIDLTQPPTTDREAMNVAVPMGDSYFDPNSAGTQTISLNRSRYDATTGTDVDNPREQINQITAWIDASMIYGSNQATADSLRSFVGGMLRTSDGNLPPTNEAGSFLAGDVRANENINLTSMQALFLREHNWWAERIAAENPDLQDEQIYQWARAIVTAEVQVITYNEFLPALLGTRAIDRYRGYDPSVNPGIANEFSTAAFRLGHSLLNDDVEFFGNDGRAVSEEISLAQAFLNPGHVKVTGIDSILKYAASTLSQEIDNQIVDGVRNFLFGAPGQGGLDLASLNIQRGRDHGLADYNSAREAYGLPRITRFSQITSDREVQQTLRELYGTVNNIDLWVGALAEDHVRGAAVGPLVSAIVADQFERLRDGDRYFYKNMFSPQEVTQLESTSLADILRRNTTLTNLQDNVFFLNAEVKGQVFYDTNADGDRDRRELGLPGIKVELLDDGSQVIATTRTRLGGNYQFDDFHETGDFAVRVVLPSYLVGTTTGPYEFLISAGDDSVGMNMGVRWVGWNFGGGGRRTTAAPAASFDTVFRQLGLSAQDTRQLRTDIAATTENASESGDPSRSLVDNPQEQDQPGRDSREASIGTEFTSRLAGRSPQLTRGR